MKIVYADLETEWRGGQSQALLTVLGLRARGHDAELIAAKSGALARRAHEAGIAVRAASRAGRRWDARRELRKVLAAGDVDIVHVNEAHSLTAAWLARANRRAALVVSRRVAYPVGRTWASKSRFGSVDRIIAISKFVADSLLDSGISPERISVVHEGVAIPPPISNEMRAAARRRWNLQDEFVLGCVGYLLPEKNQEQLIRALPALLAREPRCKIFLAGDGSERRHLEALAVGLGLREKVFFAGFVANIFGGLRGARSVCVSVARRAAGHFPARRNGIRPACRGSGEWRRARICIGSSEWNARAKPRGGFDCCGDSSVGHRSGVAENTRRASATGYG